MVERMGEKIRYAILKFDTSYFEVKEVGRGTSMDDNEYVEIKKLK